MTSTPLKITKSAVRTLAREVGAQVWHKDPDRRYETHLFGRPSMLWVTRSIVEQHDAIMSNIADHGVIGNASRHFGYDDRGFVIGNRYGAAKPKIADLNRAKQTGDLQTLADIMAWWSVQMAPRVEILKAQGRW